MSFTEVLAEIPRLTSDQRRELMRKVCEAEAVSGAAGFRAEEVEGRLVLTAPRIIRQAEVATILADFP